MLRPLRFRTQIYIWNGKDFVTYRKKILMIPELAPTYGFAQTVLLGSLNLYSIVNCTSFS